MQTIKIGELGLNKFKVKTFMCANLCSVPNAILSIRDWGLLKNCMNDCLFSDGSTSNKIEGIIDQMPSDEVEERSKEVSPDLFEKIMKEIK